MPVHLICPVCGAPFSRKPAEVHATNCCSRRCSTRLNYTLHGVNKGRRRSPSTEFHPGVAPANHLPVGTVRVRIRHKRRGDRRAFVKIAEPNVWRGRALVVWEQANGERIRGRVIHHINGDSLDDRAENLAQLTRAEHQRIHALSSNSVV